MVNPNERLRKPGPERHRLVIAEVEVVVPVEGEEVRQAVGHGDAFLVESPAGNSNWEVTAFESAEKDRAVTRRQAPSGLDVVALGISGVRSDAEGVVHEVRGRVDRFPVATVATAMHKANKPR